jgi:uncharacterized membrane protein (DUF106 family)
MIDIAFAAVVVIGISQVLQHKFIDRKRMKEQQKEMKEIQKKLNELIKKEDQKSQQEAKKLQGQMMGSMNSMMGKNMKVMLYSMVIILPIFWWLSASYKEAVINLPLSLPFLGTQVNWFWWYIICSIVLSIVIAVGKKAYEKTRTQEV